MQKTLLGVLGLLATVVAVGMAGCTTHEVGRVGRAPRAEITYAATAQYPGNPTSSETIRLAAVDDPDDGELVIYNLTDNAVGPATIWVNGAFVHRVTGIAPRGSVEIDHVELLQAGPATADLARIGHSVRKVEIQTPDGLFTVAGPSRQSS